MNVSAGFADNPPRKQEITQMAPATQFDRDELVAAHAGAEKAWQSFLESWGSLREALKVADEQSFVRVDAYTSPDLSWVGGNRSGIAGWLEEIGQVADELDVTDGEDAEAVARLEGTDPTRFIDPSRVTVGAAPYFTTGVDRDAPSADDLSSELHAQYELVESEKRLMDGNR